jgi:hypothetical protein
MSLEEQIFQPFNLKDFHLLHKAKKIPSTYFIFADSLYLGMVYVLDENEGVLEINYRTKKVVRKIGSMDDFIKEMLEKGQQVVETIGDIWKR